VISLENDTRLNLIAVATPLFATKGFAGVSIRELTVAAQINVSAISYYFNGKEGLYQAVLKEQLAPIPEALQLAKDRESLSPTGRLTFYAEQVAGIHARRPFLARFIQSEIINPTEYGGPIIESHLAQAFHFMNTALQEGVATGEFRPDLDSTYATISLAGILNFYFMTRPLIQKLLPLTKHTNSESQYTAHAFRVYLQGIKNCPPAEITGESNKYT